MSSSHLTAQQAARLLGVSVPTLYAYVSRGQIHSEATEGRRQRLYRRDDIEALMRRKQDRIGAEQALAKALSWGEPLCESSLTLIHAGHLYYRGQNVTTLAKSSSFEDVVALLWGDYAPQPVTLPMDGLEKRPELPPLDRFRHALPRLASQDPRAFDLRPQGIRASGARILSALIGLAGGCGASDCLSERLAKTWAPGQRPLLEAALILCADHELNVSTFTARCVASAGATPYEVVSAALAALSGHRHGGHCRKVETLFSEAQSTSPQEALLRRMQEGIEIPGFAHVLYPEGDPRGSCLLEMLGQLDSVTSGLIQSADELLQIRPNIDFALVALCHYLRLPAGSALALFALGRTAGWIAHALEQIATGKLIRPRASYTGILPTTE